MALLLFANNATTVLAGPISAGATSVNLAAGTGAVFPNPTTGQYFSLTFVDQASGLLREIVYCTARSGDTCTITRAQEGTTALPWQAGDIAANYWTAGDAAAMVQVTQLQQQAGNFAVDTGTTNNYAITLTPSPASLAFLVGVPIRVQTARANTGASTLTVNNLASTLIINPDGSGLSAGNIRGNSVVTFVYDGANFELQYSSGVGGTLTGTLPNPGLVAGAAVANLGFTPVQQGGGANQGANKVFIGWDGTSLRAQVDVTDLGDIAFRTWVSSIFAPLVNPSLSGTVSVSGVANVTGDITSSGGHVQAFFGAFGGNANSCVILNDFTFGSNSTGRWMIWPNGFMIQMMTANTPGDATPHVYSLPRAFVSFQISVNVTYGSNVPPLTGSVGADLGPALNQVTINNTAPGGANGVYVTVFGI